MFSLSNVEVTPYGTCAGEGTEEQKRELTCLKTHVRKYCHQDTNPVGLRPDSAARQSLPTVRNSNKYALQSVSKDCIKQTTVFNITLTHEFANCHYLFKTYEPKWLYINGFITLGKYHLTFQSSIPDHQTLILSSFLGKMQRTEGRSVKEF